MSDGAVILTKRLLLRRAKLSDLEDIHAILSHPSAMRYWSTPEHEHLSQSEEWLHSTVAETESDEFLLEYQGRVIGKAGAWSLPELGILLHPDFWRMGLMSEALSAVIPWLFARHSFPQLTAEADPRNLASIAVLQKMGFRETHRAERTMQWRDEWCDSIYFALPRPLSPV